MLDIKLIREQPEFVKAELQKVGFAGQEIDALLALDKQRRAKIHETESLRAQRAARSQAIRVITDPQEREAAVTAMRQVGSRIAELEQEVNALEEAFQQRLLEIPNLPHPDAPVGQDEHDNVVVRTVGAAPGFSFVPKPHWELGEQLGIIDFARGVKISGSRFYVLRGAGAQLQRALINWMLDLHVQQHGYTEVYPPAMVKRECLVGTGNLPKFGDNLYHDAEEDFWFVPTAEVPVTNLYRDEIFEPGQLPVYHVAYTPCFRREKMSAGRDVRGIKRGHQFDKVEMVKFVEPSTSDEELQKLLDNAEDVCRQLEIPYRIVQMCTGDLSFVAAMKYDVELWAPGCQEWLEVSSCSNFRDFQARRARIRYRPAPGARPEFVHTLNGSGLALPRVVIAVLENYQQEDGSVVIPPVLRPYMGGLELMASRNGNHERRKQG
ncbi:MAG TPA: serine--tRNA ligase [Methylomirabilota bacterium]|jgi:seryl-tRNA synthetase|nr:serine--tRNA ligase [Methylomirabilota bacterium]